MPAYTPALHHCLLSLWSVTFRMLKMNKKKSLKDLMIVNWLQMKGGYATIHENRWGAAEVNVSIFSNAPFQSEVQDMLVPKELIWSWHNRTHCLNILWIYTSLSPSHIHTHTQANDISISWRLMEYWFWHGGYWQGCVGIKCGIILNPQRCCFYYYYLFYLIFKKKICSHITQWLCTTSMYVTLYCKYFPSLAGGPA